MQVKGLGSMSRNPTSHDRRLSRRVTDEELAGAADQLVGDPPPGPCGAAVSNERLGPPPVDFGEDLIEDGEAEG